MTEHWMIDVLADLRKFSEKNCMAKLTAQLDDAIHIATSEMAATQPSIDKKIGPEQPVFAV
jgi:hypothetical protein